MNISADDYRLSTNTLELESNWKMINKVIVSCTQLSLEIE